MHGMPEWSLVGCVQDALGDTTGDTTPFFYVGKDALKIVDTVVKF